MTPRRVAALLAAGFLVIVFATWLSSKRHLERASTAGSLVLPGLEAALNTVTEVELKKGDGTHTTLKKGATDWMVAERDYRADSGKVRKLLLDMASLNVVEEKTRTPENYPQLGVEDVSSATATGTQLDAKTPGKAFSLIVGKSSSAKSGYVRVAGAPQSLLAAPAVEVDADPRRWLDHALLDIAQERVKDFTIKPADGPGYTALRGEQRSAGLHRHRYSERPGAGESDGRRSNRRITRLTDSRRRPTCAGGDGRSEDPDPCDIPHLRRLAD